MATLEFNGFYNGLLKDTRIENRAEKVMADMHTFGKATVNKFCPTNAEKIGAYRMFSNKSFDFEDLSKGVEEACKKNQGSEHLLCLQDTTEFNFTHHLERIGKEDQDIGPITNDHNAGFFCHPVLVVNPDQGIPIGLSYIKLWNRSWAKTGRHERKYQEQPIEEKESFRWISSAQHTKNVLSETPMITIIGDRESDIYEEISSVPDKQTHILVRSSINRRLSGSDKKLFEELSSKKQQAVYEIEVKGNKKRKDRVARLALKFTKVKIRKPAKVKHGDYPPYVELFAIEAQELEGTVPDGEEPILWRLLTTHQINKKEDALACIEWYSFRWLIEELFRLVKSKGLEIESTQLGTGAGLKKLAVMVLHVAVKIMVLKLALNKKAIKADVLFTPQQIGFIKILLVQIQGKTDLQKNPHPEETLAWCAWTIARLSGWSGYKSHGPPGYISIKNGLDFFYHKYEGYQIAMEHFKQ